MEIYGRPLRRALPERPDQPTLQQAMHMLVGDTYVANLSAPGSRLERMLRTGMDNREIVEEIYLAAYSRYPSEAEYSALESTFNRRGTIVKNDFLNQSQPRVEMFEDLIWASLCAREFAYNH